jgi:hypothetical protein
MKKPIHPTVYLRLLAGAVLPAFREASAVSRASAERPRPGPLKLLMPGARDLKSDATARAHIGLGFGTALRGAVILAAHDPIGRAAVARTPDGLARFQIPEIGFDRWLRFTAGTLRGGRGTPPGAPDVTVCFPHFRTALAALRDELDTMAAIGAGELIITGYIPLADRLNVVLERMSDYYPPKK